MSNNAKFRIQWESFLLFFLYFGFSYLPASTETLSLYTQCLSRSLQSAQPIKIIEAVLNQCIIY